MKNVSSDEWIRTSRSALHDIIYFCIGKNAKKTNLNRSGLLYHNRHQYLAYATDEDDILISSRMKNKTGKIDTEDLVGNEQKTKYMN